VTSAKENIPGYVWLLNAREKRVKSPRQRPRRTNKWRLGYKVDALWEEITRWGKL